jgi:ribosome-binding factor A
VFKRSTRLKELFLQEVTRAIAEVKDPGMSGFLTVTGLELSKDTKTARVYYSILGSAEDRKKTEKALERSAPFLRKTMLHRLRLKFVPKLVFVFDDTPSRANRIERLIDDLKGDSPARPAAELEEKMLDSIASRESKKRRKRGR